MPPDLDLDWLAVAGVVNSVFSAYYYLRIVRVMYLNPATSEEKSNLLGYSMLPRGRQR